MSGEALARKARSEAVLTSRSVAINPHLPVIETSDEISLRDGGTVMRRSMCLFAVSFAAIQSSSEALALLERWQLVGDLSPAERAFLGAATPTERDVIQFSWRCEALVPLMWSTGLLEAMPFPDDGFDFESLSEFWLGVPAGYWHGVGTRTAGEILDEADLIYRVHWAVREAQLNGLPPSGGLHPGVVMERHHALNWLIQYGGADWDEVSTDT